MAIRQVRSVINAREEAIALLDDYFLALQEANRNKGEGVNQANTIWWRLGKTVAFAALATTLYQEQYGEEVVWNAKKGGEDDRKGCSP